MPVEASPWATVNAVVPPFHSGTELFSSKWTSRNAVVPARRAVAFWTLVEGVRVPMWPRGPLTAAQQRTALTPGEFFPDANTTGVYDETALEEITSNLTVTTPGATYENKLFRGRVDVRATGVRFRNCKFTGPPASALSDALLVATSTAQSGLLVEDCTFAPAVPSHVTNCVSGHHFTLRRCNLYHGVDMVSVIGDLSDTRADVTIEGSWLHDPIMFNTNTQSDGFTHNDLVQWHGLLGLKILGCRLEGGCAPGLGVVDQPPAWSGSTLVSGNPFYPGRWGTSVLMGSPARKLMGELELRDSWLDGATVGLNVGGPAIELFPDVGIITGNRFGSDWRIGPDFGLLAKSAQTMTYAGNYRWNKDDPWDTSTPFSVRKNG